MRLFRIMLAVAACTVAPISGAPIPGAPSGAVAQALRAPRAEATASLDPAFLSDPRVRQLYARAAQRYARRIGPDGAFRANARGGELAIQRQRRSFDVVAGGYATGGAEGEATLARGLAAIRWGLDQRGPDGSFPAQGGPNAASPLPRSFFLDAAARSLLLVRDGTVSPAIRAQGRMLESPLGQAAAALAASPALRFMEASAENTNALWVATTALAGTGVLLGDPRLAERARSVAAAALSRQQRDGTFPERGGYDANYQSVSLGHAARYAGLLPPSPWRDEVMAALARGTERFLASVTPSGRLDESANTRTMDCGAANDDEDAGIGLALRIRYVGMVLDRPSVVARSDQFEAARQRFSHMERCPANDNEPVPRRRG